MQSFNPNPNYPESQSQPTSTPPTPTFQSIQPTPPVPPVRTDSLVPEMNIAPKGRSAGQLFFLVILLIIVLAGGAAAYTYVEKIGPFKPSFPAYNESNFVSGIINKSLSIKTSSTKIDFKLEVVPRDSGALTLDFPWANYLTFVSPDIGLDISFSSILENKEPELPDWQIQAAGSANFSGEQYSAGVDMIKKSDDLYFRVKEASTMALLPGAEAVIGKWIKLTDSSATSSGRFMASFKSGYEDAKQNQDEAKASLIKLGELAAEKGLINFRSEPTLVNEGGRDLVRYNIWFNKEAIVPVLNALDEEGKIEENNFLTGENFNRIYDYLESNAEVTFWTDLDGMPVRVEERLQIVPPDSVPTWAGKQASLSINTELLDINKLIQIEVPESSITPDEVTKLMESFSGDLLNE